MNNEELLRKLQSERNWTEKTLYIYRNAVKHYCKVNDGLSMMDMIDEADQEEEDGIRMKRRTIRTRLINFRNYLVDNMAERSYKALFSQIKAIYVHFEIEVPNLPPISEKHLRKFEPIYFKDLPDKDIIRQAFDLAREDLKSIILFQISSGCARRETLSISLKQFFESCNIECSSLEEGLNILGRNLDIIPTFRLKRAKTGKYFYTFCSPEAVRFIYYYLMSRFTKSRREISLDEQLFKLSEPTYSKRFSDLNDKMHLGKKGFARVLRGHMLRKYNASHLSMGENGLTMEEVDALQGRVHGGSRDSYFFEDPETLKRKYIKALPNVCVLDDIREINFKSKEFRKVEQELDDLKGQLSKLSLTEVI